MVRGETTDDLFSTQIVYGNALELREFRRGGRGGGFTSIGKIGPVINAAAMMNDRSDYLILPVFFYLYFFASTASNRRRS